MKSALFAFVLSLIATCATAGTATINWINPTQNTDNSPIGTITINSIYRGTKPDGSDLKPLTTVAPTTSYVDSAPAGTYCYMVTATTVVESNSSNIVCKDIPAAAPAPAPTPAPGPKPVVITTIAVVAGVEDIPVFRVAANGTRSDTVVGFVAVGTPCEGPVLFSYRGNAYRKVPKESVSFWATQPTDQIAAACG